MIPAMPIKTTARASFRDTIQFSFEFLRPVPACRESSRQCKAECHPPGTERCHSVVINTDLDHLIPVDDGRTARHNQAYGFSRTVREAAAAGKRTDIRRGWRGADDRPRRD